VSKRVSSSPASSMPRERQASFTRLADSVKL
jgi:hypothetical protein